MVRADHQLNVSVTWQLTLSRVFVPRNNCIINSRTRKNNIIYPPFSVLHQNLGTAVYTFYKRRSCAWYLLFWTRATRRNSRNKHIHCIFIRRLCTEAFSKKMLYGKLLCACTQTRHLQPLCPGTPIAASWYYCHGNTFICLTKLEMGKWNP